MNKIILDSSAWVEYLAGTAKGKKVSEKVDVAETRVFIIGPTISEILVKYLREKQNAESAILAMRTIPLLVPVDFSISEQTAKIYFEQRKQHQKFSLIDALVASAGRAIGATLITCDFDFSGLPNVIIVQ